MPDFPPTCGTMTMVFGHQAFFGWIKDGTGPVHWFNSFAAPRSPTAPNPMVMGEALRQMHSRDPTPLRAILAHVAATAPLYPIFDMPHLPQWHIGRVVLLGDAAHAVGPMPVRARPWRSRTP